MCGFIASVNKKMITVDGKSIFENLNGWQNQIGYIPQSVVILDSSLEKTFCLVITPKFIRIKNLRSY